MLEQIPVLGVDFLNPQQIRIIPDDHAALHIDMLQVKKYQKQYFPSTRRRDVFPWNRMLVFTREDFPESTSLQNSLLLGSRLARRTG
jgi:poly(3-hydroxyalkanoate) synthetase